VAADGGDRPAAVAFTLNPAGTLSVKGDAKQIRAVLSEYGITNMVPTKGGLMVGKSQAAQAQQVLSTTLSQAAPTPVEQALQRVAVAEEKQAAPSVEPEQVAEPEIDETPVQVVTAGVSSPATSSLPTAAARQASPAPAATAQSSQASSSAPSGPLKASESRRAVRLRHSLPNAEQR
jgi:hypothetical protein